MKNQPPHVPNYFLHWLFVFAAVAAVAISTYLASNEWLKIVPSTPAAVPAGKGADWFFTIRIPEVGPTQAGIELAQRQVQSWIKRLLQEGFQPMRLSDVVERLESGSDLPEKTVVLFFEPSYRHTYETLSPWLQKVRCPAVWVTDRDGINRSDRKYLSTYAISQMKKSKLWDVGFYRLSESEKEGNLMPSIFRLGNRQFHRDILGKPRSLNRRANLPTLHRLSAETVWTAQELLDRLYAEFPIEGPVYLWAREVQGDLVGVPMPADQGKNLSPMAIQALADQRSASLYWPSTAGIVDARLEFDVRDRWGSLWVFLRWDRQRGQGTQLGLLKDEVVVEQNRLGKMRRIASLPWPTELKSRRRFHASVTIVGDQLHVSLDGLPLPPVKLATAAASEDGLIEIGVFDKVRGTSGMEISSVLLTPPGKATQFKRHQTLRIPMGLRPPFKASSAKEPIRAATFTAGPEVSSSTLAKAKAAYREEDLEKAAALFEEMVERQPLDAELLRDLMWVRWNLRQFEKAEAAAARVVQLMPQHQEAWDLMARSQVAAGKEEQARQTCQKMLSDRPEDYQLRVRVAQIYKDLKDYNAAEALLIESQKRPQPDPYLYPLLASIQFLKTDYKEAARTWHAATKAFPENPKYRFEEAQSLYYSGAQKEAQKILVTLLEDPVQDRYALDFLVDDAMAQPDYAAAIQWLERELKLPRPEDAPRLLRLAQIYMAQKNFKQCVSTLNRCLEVHPRYGEALILKATVLKQMQQFPEAIRIYQRVLKENPGSLQALIGSADAYQGMGQQAKAINSIAKAREFHPENPYWRVLEADYRFAAKQYTKAKQMLTEQLQDNSRGFFPILLYHGLTPNPRDRMLASPVHMTTQAFEDQMRAISEAGFSTVTVEQLYAWLHGRMKFKGKPILITFDDGRIDSFVQADPILAKYGLKATMFVPIYNLESPRPGYASWQQVQQYQKTGRWEIQSHGDLATTYIPINPQGRMGLFLPNRRWNADAKRLESVDEWRRRIKADLESGKQKIFDQLGTWPIALAYPEGNFGQEGIPNTPNSAAANLALAKNSYALCFYQDLYGLNSSIQRDPFLLTRMEPKADWGGRYLLRYLAHNDPLVRTYQRLMRFSLMQGKTAEAYNWLNGLQKTGAPGPILFLEEARVRRFAGDRVGARNLVRRALADSDAGEVVLQQAAQELNKEDQPVWRPTISFSDDNRGRSHWIFHQYAEFPLKNHNARWRADHRYGSFKEDAAGVGGDSSSVTDHAVGLGYAQQFGLIHEWSVRFLQHFYSGGASADTTGALGIRSRWSDSLNSNFEIGRERIETARALNADVREHFGRAGVQWNQEPWRASAALKVSTLSDNNERTLLTGEVAQRIGSFENLYGVYRFTADHASQESALYYAPQKLFLHQVGLEYTKHLFRTMEATIRYLPGIGYEEGADARYVQVLEAFLPWSWGNDTFFRPFATFSRTPTYRRFTFGISITRRF